MLTYLLYAAVGYALYQIVKAAGDTNKPTKPKRKAKPANPGSGKPPHEVLGVAPNASEEEIRRAYQNKMREYHPDKVANAAAELRALAEKRSKEINAAYASMMKPFTS